MNKIRYRKITEQTVEGEVITYGGEQVAYEGEPVTTGDCTTNETSRIDVEIDPATKRHEWRDDAPEYMPMAAALKMAGLKESDTTLTKDLRKAGNGIRWMYNEQTKRCKVHIQDFLPRIKTIKRMNKLAEKAFDEHAKRKEEMRSQKEASGD